MDSDSWLPWLYVGLLFLCAAYFAMSETGVTTVSRIRLRTRLDQGDRRAKNALYIQDNFDRAISAILIGTNIVHISTATLVTVLVKSRWGVSYVALGTILCTIGVFFIGEMLPKSLAKRYSEQCALATAGSLCFFMRLFKPMTIVLSKVGEAFGSLFKGDKEYTVTEEELYDVIDNLTDEGGLDERRGELVRSALEFADVPVESVLTARVDLTTLDVDWSVDKILSVIRASSHTRLPVYEGSIDNVVGVLQIRRYIIGYRRCGSEVQLRDYIDEPCFVHQSAMLDEVLEELNRRHLNMAIVTDNYGGTVGVVTVEDILEQLVGDIWDEEDIAQEYLRRLDDGSYLADAEIDMEDLFELLEYEEGEDEEWGHKLLGEWVYENFDTMPAVGKSFLWQRLEVTVAEMRARRVLKLRLRLVNDTEGGESA